MFDSYYYGRPSLAQQRAAATRQTALEQQLAQDRLRRSQYLPDEDEDGDYGAYYDYYSPRERMYLEGLRRQEALERKRREEEAWNAKRQEAARQEQLWREQEELRREQLRQAHRREHPVRKFFDIVLQLAIHAPISQIQKRASPSPNRSPSPASSHHIPIHTPTTQRTPSPSPQLPLSIHTPERRNEAATIIQNAFRIYRSLRTLKDLEEQFDVLRNSHSFPETIDFQGPDGIIAVTPPHPLPCNLPNTTNIPKLAYNATNYDIHAYVESLNRLLLKLDGVESWGDATVRKTRRRIVGRVEEEANRVEAYWKQAWMAYIARDGNDVDGAKTRDTETTNSSSEGFEGKAADGETRRNGQTLTD
ncbi:hypothetical protein DXG03_008758 [Asterophora parasitica]|uniref:BAG domain-containing protein n=1 Tax=Asterophora parasitica TaxID=117018 RepID=A0A9P7G655_9AGAR|nr:hypothetical protein DXG03_008758 [Asterophora parasitica]